MHRLFSFPVRSAILLVAMLACAAPAAADDAPPGPTGTGPLDFDEEDDEDVVAPTDPSLPETSLPSADTVGDQINVTLGAVGGWSATGQVLSYQKTWAFCHMGKPIRPGLVAYAAGDTATWKRVRTQRTVTQWIGRAGLAVGIGAIVGMGVAASNDDSDAIGPLLLTSGVGFGTAIAVPAFGENWQKLAGLQYSLDQAQAMLDAVPNADTASSLSAARRDLPKFYGTPIFGQSKCENLALD